jgi:hypothetical protein
MESDPRTKAGKKYGRSIVDFEVKKMANNHKAAAWSYLTRCGIIKQEAPEFYFRGSP